MVVKLSFIRNRTGPYMSMLGMKLLTVNVRSVPTIRLVQTPTSILTAMLLRLNVLKKYIVVYRMLIPRLSFGLACVRITRHNYLLEMVKLPAVPLKSRWMKVTLLIIALMHELEIRSIKVNYIFKNVMELGPSSHLTRIGNCTENFSIVPFSQFVLY
jgi:hypothetical protein